MLRGPSFNLAPLPPPLNHRAPCPPAQHPRPHAEPFPLHQGAMCPPVQPPALSNLSIFYVFLALLSGPRI